MPQEKESKLNTILLSVALAVLSWIGYTTQQTSVAVAVMAERGVAQERRLAELDNRVQNNTARVQSVELAIAKLKGAATP